MNSEKRNRNIIVFLLLALVIVCVLSLLNGRDYASLQKAFIAEKIELEQELDAIITDYDDVITKKIHISQNLRNERNKVAEFRDSLSNLQEENYTLIKQYRKRIRIIEKQNIVLFAQVDSLSKKSQNLQLENNAFKEELTEKGKETAELSKKNKGLQSKLTVAAKLQLTDLTVIPLKQRSNGTYTSTSRSKRTTAFKVSFDILENKIAKQGLRTIYVQVIDTDKNVISAKGSKTFKNGIKIVYSGVFKASFYKKEMDLTNLIAIEKGSVKKGKYLITLFSEGEIKDKTIIELK